MAGIDGYTKLLLHCDGTDESTSFPDSSRVIPAVRVAHTVAAHDGAQVDTAQYKFATGSCLLDGTDDYLDVPASQDWCFGGGPFTIDLQIRFPDAAAGGVICGQKVDAQHYWNFYVGPTSEGKRAVYFTYINGSGATEKFQWATPTGGFTSSIDTWYHIELTRASPGAFTLRADGTTVSFTRNFSPGSNGLDQAMNYLNAPLTIGHDQGSGAGYFLKAWIDEFRISKGIARHTADFTAPAAAYSDTSETDTVRTLANLQAMLADNITHDVPPQIVRDVLASTRGAPTSYTPGYVGWVDTPTRDCYYYRTGNLVNCVFRVYGTSNSATTSVDLPIAAYNTGTAQWRVPIYIQINNTEQAGPAMGIVAPAGTAISIYTDWASGTWPATNPKEVYGNVTYICAD